MELEDSLDDYHKSQGFEAGVFPSVMFRYRVDRQVFTHARYFKRRDFNRQSDE